MENWIFFGANLLFTAFNAWLAWKAWQRQVAADLPTANAKIYLSSDQPVAELDIAITNPTGASWLCRRAMLRRPRRAAMYYPFALMVQNSLGEPWNPKPVDLSAASPQQAVNLVARAEPKGHCREVLWIDDSVKGRVVVDLVLESTDAQPRRHTINIVRQMPAFIPVSSRLPQNNISLIPRPRA